jgi:hypothetical protein
MFKNAEIKKVSTVRRETSAEVPKGYEEPRWTNIQDRHQPVNFDLFRLYLNEIKRHQLLSREDEMDLATRPLCQYN